MLRERSPNPSMCQKVYLRFPSISTMKVLGVSTPWMSWAKSLTFFAFAFAFSRSFSPAIVSSLYSPSAWEAGGDMHLIESVFFPSGLYFGHDALCELDLRGFDFPVKGDRRVQNDPRGDELVFIRPDRRIERSGPSSVDDLRAASRVVARAESPPYPGKIVRTDVVVHENNALDAVSACVAG